MNEITFIPLFKKTLQIAITSSVLFLASGCNDGTSSNNGQVPTLQKSATQKAQLNTQASNSETKYDSYAADVNLNFDLKKLIREKNYAPFNTMIAGGFGYFIAYIDQPQGNGEKENSASIVSITDSATTNPPLTRRTQAYSSTLERIVSEKDLQSYEIVEYLYGNGDSPIKMDIKIHEDFKNPNLETTPTSLKILYCEPKNNYTCEPKELASFDILESVRTKTTKQIGVQLRPGTGISVQRRQ